MKPSSKYNRAPVQVHIVDRMYAAGGKRQHTGGSILVQGKPMFGQLVCFTHQTAQHICHCDSPHQIRVDIRIRIPRKGHHKAWQKFYRYLVPNEIQETWDEYAVRRKEEFKQFGRHTTPNRLSLRARRPYEQRKATNTWLYTD